MKQEIFRGIATALATPWTWTEPSILKPTAVSSTGKIESGIAGLVACGTSPARAHHDRSGAQRGHPLYRGAGGRPGTGHRRHRQQLHRQGRGHDPIRLLCGSQRLPAGNPYYNKATQAGLIAHYTAIADASDKPLILYNVPSRTGQPATRHLRRPGKHPRIAAVKEASGNIGQIVEVAALAGRLPGHLFRQ